MKIRRCALVAAVLMAVCTVVILCRNKSSDGMAKSISGEASETLIPSSSAVTATVSAFVQPSSNQTATVRGTKPYVLTCAQGFSKPMRLAAEALGLRAVDVLSRNSLLVEADEQSLAKVRADGRFAVETEFRPSDKIAPALAAQIAAGAGAVDVTVVTLSSDDHRRVQDRVVARGGEILTGCFNEGDGFRARMSASLVSELASFGDIRWMEVFNRPRPLNNIAVTNVAMNVQEAWDVLGLSGAGQSISTSDSGIDTGDKATMHEDLRDQVAGIKVVKDCLDHDESGHGTHTAGSIVGTGAMWTNETGLVRGTAWGAQLYAWFCGRVDGKLGTPTTMAELFRGNAEGSEWNAYIHSASWGETMSAGDYDKQCADIDQYVWRNPEFLPVFAAGNEGSDARTISSPASAKNVLAVGATQNLRTGHDGGWGNGDPTKTAVFSSRGPCKDGRTKPDIAAPGVGILSTRAQGIDYSYGNYDDYYAYDSGTSMACPLTAGAVALVREWLVKNPEAWKVEGKAEVPTAALMKAIVTGGAKDAARPNNDQGWGRVDLMETLAPSNRAVKLIDRIPFEDGAELIWIVKTTNAAPLDVQLAWIDFPGAPTGSQSEPKIVNDLDLTVTRQDVNDGKILYGNGGREPDERNTLESVRFDSVSNATYYVTVSCPHIFADYNEGGAAALYIRGAFDPDAVVERYTVRIVKSPETTNTYARLDKALNDAEDGDVIEILDTTELRESVVLTDDRALTVVATNANPQASPITRRNGADILVKKGSLLFTNFVFRTEGSTPVRAAEDGVVKVAGTAVFDDIASRTPGILTDRPEGFELAGRLENGITVECTGASQPGDRFGVYSCPDAVAVESAPRLVSINGTDRAGAAKDGFLEWKDKVEVDPEVAVGYIDGDEPVYYRTLDRLFDELDEHPDGTNVVLTKSGLRLEKPRTLSGKQSIVAQDGVGEIVVRPEGSAGFAIGAGCDLTVAGITFEDYTGNGLFVVSGTDAKLTVSNSVFRDIEGTNKWSGAIAILKGSVFFCDSTNENCHATGKYRYRTAIGTESSGTVLSKGGAIYLAGSGCSLELNGGRITGCSANNLGGGVYANAGSVVRVRGALQVKGNWSGINKVDDDIYLVNAEASKADLLLSGRLTKTDAVGVRYGASCSDFGNDVGDCLAAVADGVDQQTATNSVKAFFNDTNPDGTKAVVHASGTKLLWAVRTSTWNDGDQDVTVRVNKGGKAHEWIKPEEAFGWIDADAKVEVLKDAGFGGDLVVTNGVKVTLMSTNDAPYSLVRSGELMIRVLPGASLTVTNLVLDGGGPVASVGFIKVVGGSLELQSGAVVRNVIGSADRASGAVSVQGRGTFTMQSGAEIVNCQNAYVNAGSKSGYGGGLLVEDQSTANLLGGSISECSANRGGGVFIGTESTVNIAGDMKIRWNHRETESFSPSDNLCVADLSELHLVGPLTGQIGYNEGRSGDTNVFGKVTFSGSESDIQASAHKFTHDFTKDIGMAVSDGTETLLVWGNALDADGKYDGYELLEGDPYKVSVPFGHSRDYNGEPQTGVDEGVGYRILSGNVATNVGNYTAVVTNRAGFVWKDNGTTGEREVEWSIEPVEYELKGVSFEDETFVYDGTMKYLALTGTLPDGFSVKYENNGRWQPGTNEVKAVISGFVPNYTPDHYTTTLQAKLIIIDPAGLYHGETEPPGPLPTVTTNWPSAIAFESITRVADTNWILTVTNRVKWCRYRLICTDDLVRGFTTTGDWEQATAAGPWTTNVIFSADEVKPAYFWRAEGTWGIVPEGEE